VIRGWGDTPAEISIDGRRATAGPSVRVGHTHGLEGTDLVVWLALESSKTVRLRIARPA